MWVHQTVKKKYCTTMVYNDFLIFVLANSGLIQQITNQYFLIFFPENRV